MNNRTKSTILSILIIFFISAVLNGQTGSIEGIVADKASSVSYVSYTTRTVENVSVEPGKVTSVNIELEGNLVSLGDINVTAVRRTNTEISMITDIKTSHFVSTGISGQQISKTLDKDASEVVKRVPGITIMDNRFLIVRGLSQRYNNVWLNNAATPSAEADVKAFSFDIIPSSMIENIMIFKSPAAELPADFSGGFVKITTKNLPEKNGIRQYRLAGF
ncbi:MAG: TonB-dependent receptor [Bacteroidetes bacterium]|nr:TonB-dependent receptor [Bacteroidota bacterium]